MPIRKRWSKEELSSLEKDYGILSPNELEKKYCIRYSAIKRAANNHGIKMRKIWSDEELSLLKEDYGILLPGELEKKFGINYSDIRSAAARHNIKSKRYTGKRRFWTKAEEENLKIDWETSTLTAKNWLLNTIEVFFLNEMYRDVWQYHSLLYLPRKYKQITMWKREREAYEYGDLSRTLPERAKILHRQVGLGILQ